LPGAMTRVQSLTGLARSAASRSPAASALPGLHVLSSFEIETGPLAVSVSEHDLFGGGL
jgi:hypothetical protein